MQTLKRFLTEDSGQGLTEYALILALVSVGLMTVLVLFRDSIGRTFDRVAEVLDGAPAGEYTPGS